MKRMITLAISLLAGSAFATPVTVFDQSDLAAPLGGAVNPTSFAPLGQSFTPTLTGIDFVTVGLQMVFPTQFDVSLYQGVGTGGAMLGTSNSANATSSGFYEFDFLSRIALTPGQIYTIIINPLSTNGGLLADNGANPYSGGTLIESGSSILTVDALFAEGIKVDVGTVPEPGTLSLLGATAIAGLLAQRKSKATSKAKPS